MKTMVFAVLLSAVPVSAVPALAAEMPQDAYLDGVFQGSLRNDLGIHCSSLSELHAPSTPPGNYYRNGYSSKISPTKTAAEDASSCAELYATEYVVKSDGATYVLTPKGDPVEASGGLLIRSSIPKNVLNNLPSQTPVKLRSDGRHFFVKIGAHESVYSAMKMQ